MKALYYLAETELFSQDTSFNYWDQFINMMISLGLLLSLILVTVWFLKRFMTSRNRILNRAAAIQILEKRNLSQKSFLYLIQIENKKILISDSPSGPNMLCEIATEEFSKEEEAEEPVPLPLGIKNKIKGFFIKNG